MNTNEITEELEVHPPVFITPAEAGEYLRVSVRHLSWLQAQGKIPAVALPGKGTSRKQWRYSKDDLDAWMGLGCPSATEFERKIEAERIQGTGR